jgi:hypothetical protein
MRPARDRPLARPARYASTPRLSPDGKKLATTVRDGASQDVWIYDIERDSMTRLTFGTQTFVSAIWSRMGATSSAALSATAVLDPCRRWRTAATADRGQEHLVPALDVGRWQAPRLLRSRRIAADLDRVH